MRFVRASGPASRLAAVGLCAVVAIGTAAATGDADPPGPILAVAWSRVVWPILRMVGFVAFGVFLGHLVQAVGISDRLARLARPLLRWGRFSADSAASFAMAFVSGAAAHAMLAEAHRDGRIERRELVLAALMNSQPAYLVHLPSTAAILLPLTGVAGLLYLGLTFVAALLRTLLLVTCARAAFHPAAAGLADSTGEARARPRLDARKLLTTLARRLRRILLVVVPVYGGILAVEHLGFFDWLRETIAARVVPLILPVEAVGVVMLGVMAEFTSAAAAAGALLDAGSVTTRQAVIALLTGTILATPLRSLRHQIPMYTGIFSPRLGIRLVTLSQLLRVLSVALVGLAYGLLSAIRPL